MHVQRTSIVSVCQVCVMFSYVGFVLLCVRLRCVVSVPCESNPYIPFPFTLRGDERQSTPRGWGTKKSLLNILKKIYCWKTMVHLFRSIQEYKSETLGHKHRSRWLANATIADTTNNPLEREHRSLRDTLHHGSKDVFHTNAHENWVLHQMEVKEWRNYITFFERQIFFLGLWFPLGERSQTQWLWLCSSCMSGVSRSACANALPTRTDTLTPSDMHITHKCIVCCTRTHIHT